MDSLFGLSMNLVMYVLLGAFIVSALAVIIIFLRNRIVFLMGVRNIPRRRAQTVLIVVGLMLSTVIITAAFTTGDTVDYSITKQTYDLLGHADVILDGEVGATAPSADPNSNDDLISSSDYETLIASSADSTNLDGVLGMLFEPIPVVNPGTSLSEPDVYFVGLDAERTEPFPDLKDARSGESYEVTQLEPGEVFLNESAADELDAAVGDTITGYVQGQPNEFTVRAVVKDTGASGAIDSTSPEGMVTTLDTLQELFDTDGVRFVLVSASGGVRPNEATLAAAELEIRQLIGENNLRMEVSDTKSGLVDEAEEIGNFMTTFFLLLGLFSIGAGMLLIVMIFVMLAAERKPEMGMARAVGMKRLHLIEMFVAEGSAYNLGAALVGVITGVAVAFALTTAASAIFSAFGFTFTPHATLRTLVISFCLGAVLTFLTVAFSSWRISNLNIVSAIRDLQEISNKRMGWKGLAFWVFAVLSGAFMFWAGLGSDSAFLVALGFSVVGGGVAVLLTHFGAPARPSFTVMGLILLMLWGLSAGNRLDWLFGDLNGGIEMFFLSGVAMVTSSTFVLIYNADIFLALVERVGGAFGSLLPSLRTAIAYPMANRFRTGMTLAMISLVVFAITTMSTMNLNYDKLFLQDESRGGWDVVVIENPNNPFPTLKQALSQTETPEVANEIKAEGSVFIAGFDSATEISQDGENFDDYFVRGVTNDFVDGGNVPLDMIANGYDSQDAVWQALKNDPNTAVIDRFTVESGFGPSEFTLEGIDISSTNFEAPTITVRDANSGGSREVKIIGIISFGASGNFTGVFLGEESYLETFGEPELSIHYVSLVDPGNATDVADSVEAALVTSGAQAKSLEEIAQENTSLSRNFLYLMQAFMGLGLVVGIAAIGVIAFRTVVERRQQIGMLRAIGYKRRQVALSFLLESSFVTVLGVASGVVLGLWLAYFLVSGDDFPGGGGTFYIPWAQIAVISVLTILASVLMTWIPARQAASVPTAEALRYE